MDRASSSILLGAAKVPALLVTNLINIRYLTGVSVSAGSVLVTPKRTVLFVDSRYREIAEHGANPRIAVRDALLLPRMLKEVPLCGFEADHVTVTRLARWKREFLNTKFVQTSGVVENVRRQKDEEELKYLRRAARITRELLRRVPSALRSSVSERELAWKLAVWARELGADGMSFDPIVAFGSHTSRPHHQPTSRVLKKGHIVQVDVGAVYGGYCGDLSAVYFTASPSPLEEKAYGAICEARDAALDGVKTGASTHELDRVARKILKKHGMEDAFTHALGHGVGLEVHEGVTLSQNAPEKKLLAREVITIEPGVYLPGRFGMRVEEMVIVQ